MMRDSSGGDFAATIIPITRSLIFWECTEVRRWLEALQFDAQVCMFTRSASVCRLPRRRKFECGAWGWILLHGHPLPPTIPCMTQAPCARVALL